MKAIKHQLGLYERKKKKEGDKLIRRFFLVGLAVGFVLGFILGWLV